MSKLVYMRKGEKFIKSEKYINKEKSIFKVQVHTDKSMENLNFLPLSLCIIIFEGGRECEKMSLINLSLF